MFLDVLCVGLEPAVFLEPRKLHPGIEFLQGCFKPCKVLVVSFAYDVEGLYCHIVHHIVSNKKVLLNNLMLVDGYLQMAVVKLVTNRCFIAFDEIFKISFVDRLTLVWNFTRLIG